MPHVLVVDDDADILESIKSVLEFTVDGVEVHTAPSGPAALEVLREVRPALIITDFRMPGMNGAEFLERAEPLAPGVPHVLVSAFPESTIRASLGGARVDELLGKPMDVDAIIEMTRRYLSAG